MGQNPSRLDQFGGSSGFSHSTATTTSTAATTATTATTASTSASPLAPPAPLSAPLPNPPTRLHLAPPAPLSAPLASTVPHPRLSPANPATPPDPSRLPLLPVQPNEPRVDPASVSASGRSSTRGHAASSAGKKIGRKLSLKRGQSDEKRSRTTSKPSRRSCKAAETRAGILDTNLAASTPPAASSPPSSPRKLSRANFSLRAKSTTERVERVEGDCSGSPSILSQRTTSFSTPFPPHVGSASHSVTPVTLAPRTAAAPAQTPTHGTASPAVTPFRAGSTSPRSSRFSTKSARRAEREWRARVAAISASAGKRSPSFGPAEGVRGPVPPRRRFATVPKTEREIVAGAQAAGVANESASSQSGGGGSTGSGSRSESRSPSPASKGQGLSDSSTPDGTTPDSKVGHRGLPITPPSPPSVWAYLHSTEYLSDNVLEIQAYEHDTPLPPPSDGHYTIPLADDNASPRVYHNRPRSRKVSVPSSISSYYFDQAGAGVGAGAGAASRPSSLAVSTLFAIPQGGVRGEDSSEADSSEANSSEGDKSRDIEDSRGLEASRGQEGSRETDLRDVESERQDEEEPCRAFPSADKSSGDTDTDIDFCWEGSSTSQTRVPPVLEATLDDASHAPPAPLAPVRVETIPSPSPSPDYTSLTPTPITSSSTLSSSEDSFGDFEPGSKSLWSAPYSTPTTLHFGLGYSTSAPQPPAHPGPGHARLADEGSGDRLLTPRHTSTVTDHSTPARLPIPRTSPSRITQRKPVGLALDAAALNPVSAASEALVANMISSSITISQSGETVCSVKPSRGEREGKGRNSKATLRKETATETSHASVSAPTPSRPAPELAIPPNTPCSPMTAWILSAPSINIGLGMDLGLDVEYVDDADRGRSSPTHSAMSAHPFAMAAQEAVSRASSTSHRSPRTLQSTSDDPVRKSEPSVPRQPEPARSARPHMLGSASVAPEWVGGAGRPGSARRTEVSVDPRALTPGDGPTSFPPPLFPDLIASPQSSPSPSSPSKGTARSRSIKLRKTQGSGTGAGGAPRRPFPLAPGHPLRQRFPSNGTNGTNGANAVRSPRIASCSPTRTRSPTLTPGPVPASSSTSRFAGCTHVSPFRGDMLGTSPLRVPMRKLDLTPGMGLGEVERPPKSGMPMRLRRDVLGSRTRALNVAVLALWLGEVPFQKGGDGTEVARGCPQWRE
ncbi:hypothetical protein JCM24511_07432 [Saitozyma sp. JCM 24511]|nr:hypothetical protein JCM24511_07432 [Saitozyma sp. JCM 24511]